MFDFVRFMMRNPSYVTTRWRRLSSTRKAMNAYRDKPENSTCRYCGRNKKLEVHHIFPVSVEPEKADDQANMIMLCRKPPCHQIVGHDGDFGSRFVENAKEICDGARVVKTTKHIE